MKLTDEQFKAAVAENPEAKFKIISTGYEFRAHEDYKGTCSYLKDAGVGMHGSYVMQVDGYPYPLSFLAEELEPIGVHVEETTKIKFPCCVPTSEIKDAETLLALVALFEANGATVYDGVDCGGGHEFDRVDSWDYFGVSLRAGGTTFRTDFYDDFEDYNQSEVSSELTIYHVAELLGLVAKEDPVASQEAITESLGDNPSVGIDLAKEGSDKTVEALITITQEVKYAVVIKGTAFTFTQDELDALTEELLGFTTL